MGGGGDWGFHVIRDWEILFFVMSEFKFLFSVTCDESIFRDAWCVKFIFCEVWWNHLIYVIDTQFPIFKMRLFDVDAGRDLWCWYSYFLWSVIEFFISRDLWWAPPNTPPHI